MHIANRSGTPSRADIGSVGTGAVVLGLTLGWTLGLAGSLSSGTPQAVLWAISSMGLMTGLALLAFRQAATDIVAAAGFALVALGEAVIHVQGPAGLDAFASATFAYLPGLILLGSSSWGPLWTRITALGSGLAFGAHAFAFLLGAEVGPEGTIASIGYLLLTLTLIGWTWMVIRGRDT